jgi:release factor glutamine methyltransferase
VTRRIADLLAAARGRIAVSEARLLIGHVLGKSATWLAAHPEEAADAPAARAIEALLARRAAGEPIAYLTGEREFYGRPFRVAPDVLIPRPETELLVDIAKTKLGAPQGLPSVAGSTARVLDLGVGSGCLAVTLALELPQARVTALDISPAALNIARTNAQALGAQVDFVASDWFAALPPGRFDLIVANPPYIAASDPHLDAGDLRFEPRAALTDHADGLAAIRRIVAAAPAWLAQGGWLFMEHGYDQAAAVHELLAAAGLVDLEQHADLAGILRVTGGAQRG